MLKMKLLLVLSLAFFKFCIAQEENVAQDNRLEFFVAYEFGEAAFNKFRSLSGEIGIKLQNEHLLRLTHMNVNLTEAHLSSSFAGAVDGDDVEGKFFGFEAFYDFPILLKGLYVGPSIGYYKNEYHHILLDQNLKNNTFTLGLGISYSETNIFKIDGLYYRLSIPFRISLNPIEETVLGETTINNDTFEQNIWFFIGYEF